MMIINLNIHFTGNAWKQRDNIDTECSWLFTLRRALWRETETQRQREESNKIEWK